MNINHEYWHLRENDINNAGPVLNPSGNSILEIKFSFANCLDDSNEIKPAPPYGYVPEILFHNLNWMDHLANSRFPAVAGWNKSYDEIFTTLNLITQKIFSQFKNNGVVVTPNPLNPYGQNNTDFGLGTVHHAVGTLRMPYKASYLSPIVNTSVVDEDLRVNGTDGLYVCDMSVLPISTAANPVRTLTALALRLSEHLAV
jgi:choline dehydrogenase-like flavoprotein